MEESKSNNLVEEMLGDIRLLLSRSVALQEGALDLGKQSGENTTILLQNASTDTELARQRTGLAQESTSLVRAQTRLSARSTELAEIRTDLGRERTKLATERSDLAALRTELARARTGLAQQRVGMADTRTRLSEIRTGLSVTVTIYSKIRVELARSRTYLALIRTGLAFVTLAIFLFREFPVSWWTVFDVSLGIASAIATAIGLVGYIRARRAVKHLDTKAADREETHPDLKMLKA